jgi:hypothetical protein
LIGINARLCASSYVFASDKRVRRSMFCCTFLGLLLMQVAAFAGFVKVDRSDGTSTVRMRETLSSTSLLIIAGASIGMIAMGGLLFYSFRQESLGLVMFGHQHICSVFGIAPR